jgi:hypothetical protein
LPGEQRSLSRLLVDQSGHRSAFRSHSPSGIAIRHRRLAVSASVSANRG